MMAATNRRGVGALCRWPKGPLGRGFCLGLALILAWPGALFRPAAAAEPQPRVGTAAVYGAVSPQQERELLAAARAALAESGFYAVDEGGIGRALGAYSGPAEEEYRQAYRRGAELLKKGRAQYEAVQLDAAIENLQGAKAAFRQAMAVMTDNAGLLASHLYLGMTFLSKGLEGRGKEELRNLIILDPRRDSRELASKYYRPQVRQTYRQLKDDIISGRRGKIEVNSDPAGAEVYLDGRRSGTTPTVLPDLPVGEHFLVLRHAQCSPWMTSKLVVEGSNPVDVALPKKSSLASIRNQFRPVTSAAELGLERITFLDDFALGSKSEIFLFLEQLPGNRLAGQLYDMRNQQVSARQEVPLAHPAASLRQLVQALKPYLSSAGYVSAELAAALPPPAPVAVATSPASPLAQLPAPAAAVPAQPPSATTSEKPLDTALPQTETTDERFVNPLLQKNPPGEEKMWYESWWLWGSVIGAVVLGAGGYLLLSGALKGAANTSSLTIHTQGAK